MFFFITMIYTFNKHFNKKKNKELENENTDLKQEIEKMKQKKFMGLFKVFK